MPQIWCNCCMEKTCSRSQRRSAPYRAWALLDVAKMRFAISMWDSCPSSRKAPDGVFPIETRVAMARALVKKTSGQFHPLVRDEDRDRDRDRAGLLCSTNDGRTMPHGVTKSPPNWLLLVAKLAQFLFLLAILAIEAARNHQRRRVSRPAAQLKSHHLPHLCLAPRLIAQRPQATRAGAG